MKHLSHLDLATNELRNAVIQQLASAPSSPVQGQIYYNTGDDNLYVYDGSGWVDLTVQGGGSGDFSSNTATSVDGEVVLFSGTGGKTGKRATGSGIAKLTSGVLSTATSGTDYAPATSGSSALKGNGSGGFSNATLNDVGAATASYSLNSQKITSLADGTATTDAVNLGQVQNLVNGVSWKTAVRVATTANGTLASAFENGDTVDGVTLATGDRILIKDQSTATENGIYVVAASGAPTRASDADTGAEIKQATVMVQEGTVNADSTWTLTNNGTITLGSTNLVFALQGTGSVPAASTTVAGKVELADSTEAEAKSSSVLALTPASVVNFPTKKTFTIGDGSTTSIACTHSLGTKEVITQLRQAADDAVVEADIVNTSTTVTTITFAVAPATNAIKVVIIG